MRIGLVDIRIKSGAREARDGKHGRWVPLTAFNSILCDSRLEREGGEGFLSAQNRVEKLFGSFNRVQNERFFRRQCGKNDSRNNASRE